MQQRLLILPVVGPAVFWAAYHYHKDRDLPEPPGNLLLCFVLGIIAAALIASIWIWRLRLMQNMHEQAMKSSDR